MNKFACLLIFSTSLVGQPAGSLRITGTVRTPEGVPLAGITIALSTGQKLSTDTLGSYTLNLSSAFSGTLTPEQSGYTFMPAMRLFNGTGLSFANQDFIAVAAGTPIFTVTGKLETATRQPISGALIQFDGGLLGVTFSSGTYSMRLPAGYIGTATPLLSGYSFNPPMRMYRGLSSDLANQDYLGTPPVSRVTISGRLRTSSGQALTGAQVSFTNGGPTVTVDAAGTYRASVGSGYDGSAVPVMPGYSFNPPSRSYSNLTIDRSGEDFTAIGMPTYPIFTAGPIPSGCTLPPPASQFVAGVPGKIYAWAAITATPGTPYYFQWKDPSHDFYSRQGGSISFNGSGCAWSSIDPSLADVRRRLGTWRVELWVNGQLVSANAFSLNPETVKTFTISGAVRRSDGSGVPGVLIPFDNGGPTVLTNEAGLYSASLPAGYSGAVVPSLARYNISPIGRTFRDLSANRTGEDFTADPFPEYPIFTGTQPQGCTPPARTSQFTAGITSTVYAWVPIENVASSDTYSWIWYDPGANRAGQASGPVGFNGSGCDRIGLDFSPTSGKAPGTWRVDFLLRGVLKDSSTFQFLPATTAPVIRAVTHAASSANGSVSPGQLITIYGSGLGSTNLALLKLASTGLVETSLEGTRVLFDGVPAPLVYVRNDQVGAVAPYAIAGRTSTKLRVEFQGALSSEFEVRVAEANPAIFAVNQRGSGPGAILNQNNTLNSAQAPARRNSIIILYATGEGRTNPAVSSGTVTSSVVRPILPVSVTLGGRAAEVLFAGAAPGMVAGVLQVNVLVPANLVGGDAIPVVLSVGGVSSPAGVTVAIER